MLNQREHRNNYFWIRSRDQIDKKTSAQAEHELRLVRAKIIDRIKVFPNVILMVAQQVVVKLVRVKSKAGILEGAGSFTTSTKGNLCWKASSIACIADLCPPPVSEERIIPESFWHEV